MKFNNKTRKHTQIRTVQIRTSSTSINLSALKVYKQAIISLEDGSRCTQPATPLNNKLNLSQFVQIR